MLASTMSPVGPSDLDQGHKNVSPILTRDIREEMGRVSLDGITAISIWIEHSFM